MVPPGYTWHIEIDLLVVGTRMAATLRSQLIFDEPGMGHHIATMKHQYLLRLAAALGSGIRGKAPDQGEPFSNHYVGAHGSPKNRKV